MQKMKKSHKTTQTLRDLFLGQTKNVAILQSIQQQEEEQRQPPFGDSPSSSKKAARDETDQYSSSGVEDETGLMLTDGDDDQTSQQQQPRHISSVDFSQLHPSYTNATDVPMEIYKDETLFYRIQKEQRRSFDQPTTIADDRAVTSISAANANAVSSLSDVDGSAVVVSSSQTATVADNVQDDTRRPAVDAVKRFRERSTVAKEETFVSQQQQHISAPEGEASTTTSKTERRCDQMFPPPPPPKQVPLRSIKFCNVGQVHQLITEKTKEYNNLRESLLRPVFYDISVVESQKVFAQLSDDIEYLKKIKAELKGNERVDQLSDETMSMVIHDVLFNNGSLVSSSPFCDVRHFGTPSVGGVDGTPSSRGTATLPAGRKRTSSEPYTPTGFGSSVPGLLPCVEMYQTIEHRQKRTAMGGDSTSSCSFSADPRVKKRKCFRDTPIGRDAPPTRTEEEEEEHDEQREVAPADAIRRSSFESSCAAPGIVCEEEKEGTTTVVTEETAAVTVGASLSASLGASSWQKSVNPNASRNLYDHMEVSSESILSAQQNAEEEEEKQHRRDSVQQQQQERVSVANAVVAKNMTRAMNVYRQMMMESADDDDTKPISREDQMKQQLASQMNHSSLVPACSLSVQPQQQVVPLSQQQLKLKDVADKDKKCTVVLAEDAFVEKVHDRRIKHKRACDEHTVINLVAAKIAKRRENEYANRRLLPSQDDIVCKRCGGVCDADTVHACYVCSECGTVDPTMRVSETDIFTNRYMLSTAATSSFKAMRGSTYKPLGHFTEIMYQLQGKRKSKAPYHVKKVCRDYCIRYGIKRIDITEAIIRRCLKCYRNGSQYYKYAMEIACELRGIPPPYMTEAQESILTYLYPCTVHAYKTSKRYLDRKMNRVGRIKELPNNMLGNYVLYKLCELCGFAEFLPYIRLSKNVDNIRENDESWRHVCKQNKWKFYKTKYFG